MSSTTSAFRCFFLYFLNPGNGLNPAYGEKRQGNMMAGTTPIRKYKTWCVYLNLNRAWATSRQVNLKGSP